MNNKGITKEQKKILIIISVSLFVLLVACGLGGFFYYKSATKNDDNGNANLNPNAKIAPDMAKDKKTEDIPVLAPAKAPTTENLHKSDGVAPPAL